LLSAEFVRAVADHVGKEGVEFWDRMNLHALIEEKILSDDFSCDGCHNHGKDRFTLERDILDVWFDSGASSYAVLAQKPETLGVPADVYFEGSDQHRGWFQSSMLCGMVLYNHAPMKTIVTHGFVVDEHKRKMSKSVGNVVSPKDVITKNSRDILRLWVASADFVDDLVISDKLLGNIAEMYRKIRNTCRFLIANLYDFNIATDAVQVDQMLAIDQYALAGLHDVDNTIRTAYDNYHFSTVVGTLNSYCTNDLSAVYLDILKDRLYVEKPDGLQRRSAQTVMYNILDVLTRLMAPVLSFLAEELSDSYQKDKVDSIHLQDFTQSLDVWARLTEGLQSDRILTTQVQDMGAVSYHLQKRGQWNALTELRDAVLKAIEPKRTEGVVKHSYEAHVTLWLDPASLEGEQIKQFITDLMLKEDVTRFFKDWFVVSHVTFAADDKGLGTSVVPWLSVAVEHAQGAKCPRCWRWDVNDHQAGLCKRCASVLG
jgi:isoleucyl-tRNA synthetase